MKIILVTGASKGLGAAFAELVAGPNTHVISLARTGGALEELDDKIKAKGGTSSLAVTDITEREKLEQLAASIQLRWGRLDLLIHAAIYTPSLSPIAHGFHNDLEKAIKVNVLATERLISCFDPLLNQQNQDTAALFFADSLVGKSNFGRYASSKVAQIAIAESWKSETNSFRLSVYIANPNPMSTNLRLKFYPGEDRKRLAKPMDEAKRIASNLTKENSQVFGSIFR